MLYIPLGLKPTPLDPGTSTPPLSVAMGNLHIAAAEMSCCTSGERVL